MFFLILQLNKNDFVTIEIEVKFLYLKVSILTSKRIKFGVKVRANF